MSTTSPEVPTDVAPSRTPRDVSVVIISKDETELATSLELLKPQCEELGAQCVVVDASQKRLDDIRVAHPWVHWIDFEGPFWRSSTIPHQRNAGVRAARGSIIAFCDSGGQPSPQWLREVTAPLLHADHLVVGPIPSLRKGVFKTLNDVPDGTTVDWAPTANMAFTETVFDATHGFEESLFYGSDVNFVMAAADHGYPCVALRAAVSSMDWGPAKNSARRSWRYGKAWARLFNLHRDRAAWMIRRSPERVFYPLVLLSMPFAVATALATSLLAHLHWAWLLLATYPALYVLLYWNNRNESSPSLVVRDHVTGALATIDEMARTSVGEMAPVLFTPNDPSPYVHNLAKELTALGTPVQFDEGPTPSHSANIFLSRIALVFARWRGVKILHIHWAFKFADLRVPFGKILAQQIFAQYLWTAKKLGMKIVWTAHNILPHEQIFANDVKARKTLVRYADAIVALTPYTAQQVEEKFGAKNVTVIPHGPMPVTPTTYTRRQAKEELTANRTLFSFFGQVRPYKGVDVLIDAASLLADTDVDEKISIRIFGNACPRDYAKSLTSKVLAARNNGADIVADFQRLSDQELACLLLASDFCVFPFVTVTNSGTVLTALGVGVPIIIPNLPELDHIPDTVCFRFEARNPRSLADTIVRATTCSDTTRSAMSDAARAFASTPTWAQVATAYNDVYKSLYVKK